MIAICRWKCKSFETHSGTKRFIKPVTVWLTRKYVWRAYLKPFGWFCFLDSPEGTLRDIKKFVEELLESDYYAYALEDDSRLIGRALKYKQWFLNNVEDTK